MIAVAFKNEWVGNESDFHVVELCIHHCKNNTAFMLTLFGLGIAIVQT